MAKTLPIVVADVFGRLRNEYSYSIPDNFPTQAEIPPMQRPTDKAGHMSSFLITLNIPHFGDRRIVYQLFESDEKLIKIAHTTRI